jgi:hypothetical protein
MPPSRVSATVTRSPDGSGDGRGRGVDGPPAGGSLVVVLLALSDGAPAGVPALDGAPAPATVATR